MHSATSRASPLGRPNGRQLTLRLRLGCVKAEARDDHWGYVGKVRGYSNGSFRPWSPGQKRNRIHRMGTGSKILEISMVRNHQDQGLMPGSPAGEVLDQPFDPAGGRKALYVGSSVPRKIGQEVLVEREVVVPSQAEEDFGRLLC